MDGRLRGSVHRRAHSMGLCAPSLPRSWRLLTLRVATCSTPVLLHNAQHGRADSMSTV